MPRGRSSRVTVADVAAAVASSKDRTVERLRRVRRELSRGLEDRSATEVLALARASIDEEAAPRWFAYELVHHHPEAMATLSVASLEDLGRGMMSWGEVDPFALYLSGVAWREGLVSDRDILRWAGRDDRWWRRAAIVSTVPLNLKSRGGEGDAERTLVMCDAVRSDRDDMVIKGLSWALRELAKREPGIVSAYLTTHEPELASRVVREVRNKLETGLKNPKRRAP